MKEKYYKYLNGNRVEISNREVKAYIMKINNWTSEQYNKQYDILRNKLRSFEAFERQSGVEIQPQSPLSLLFKEAKAKKREGTNYKPSIKMQRIRSFTSVSSGKAGKRALESGLRYRSKRMKMYEEATLNQFKGLINNNAGAKYIYENIKDPIKREKALADYANALNAKIDEQDKVTENEAFATGETFGSNDEIDFDISEYLD